MGFTNPYPASRLTVDSTNSLVTGMQLWFPFTTGTGTSAQCILHAYHTGTLQSGASWASSDIGTVLELDGSSEVDFTTDISRNKTAVSCSAWIKPDSVTGRHFVFYESNSLNSGQTRFGLRIDGGAIECVGRDDDSDNFTRFASSYIGTVVTGVWQHAVAVFDPTGGGCKVYLDGVDVTSSSINTGDGFPNTASLTQVVGGIGSTSGYYFDGQIQNLKVWDRAITAAEVATLYHRPWEGSNYGDIWPYSPPAAGSMTVSTDTAATSLMTNCVGWWPLTTGTGTTAKDIVGTNDGALTNVDWLDSELGMSSDFQTEANGDHITTSFSAAGQSEITVSFWMRNDGGATPNTYGRLLSMGFLNALDCFINKNSNNSLSFAVNNTNAYFSSPPSTGEWFHFCGVWSQSSRQELYINGSQVATVTANTSVIGSGSHNVIIGGTTDGPRTFHGGIQNVRIWDRALSSSEVALLAERPFIGAEYNETAPLYPPVPSSLTPLDSSSINTSLEGWWPLTETDNFASGAADISGNGNNGTQSGGVLSEFSELGTVASFDGSNDRVLFNSTTMPSSYPFAVSAWIQTSTTTGVDFRTVAAFGNTSSNTSFAILGVDKNTSRARWTIRAGSTALAIGGTAVNDGKPHLLVGVSASASDHRIYVDGVLVATSTSSISTNTYNTFNVGALQRSSAIQFFDGNISNVRFWNRSLSSSEVADLFYEPWIGSAYPSTGGGTPSYFVAAQFNRLGIGPRFRRL